MDTDEIVRGKAGHNLPELLRIIAYPSFYRKDLEAAAALIESLKSDNEMLHEQSDEECDSCACEIANERDCLREEILEIKTEQEKGCEYCNNTDYISEGKQKIETTQWDEYEDGFIVIRQHINFCPMCGKRLEEHNE